MLPEGIPTVRLTGRFLFPDGRPLSGQVVFRAPSLITFGAYDVILGGPVTVPLDATGAFAVELPATDAPGMNPSSWSYTVAEQLAGVSMNRVYQVLLPAETPEVDLADIAPTDPSTPNYVAVRGDSAYEVAVKNGFVGTVAQWLASLVGPPGVIQSVNGKSTAAVTLAAADVGAVAVNNARVAGTFTLDGTTGTYRPMKFQTAGVDRWQLQLDGTAEGGSNTGSNLRIAARNDDGTDNGVALWLSRSNKRVAAGMAASHGEASFTSAGFVGVRDSTVDPVTASGGIYLYSKGGIPFLKQGDGTAFQLVPAVANNGGYSRMDGTLHVVYAGTQADAFKASDATQSKYTAVNKSAELVTNATATFNDARIGGGLATFGGGAGGILAFANAATPPTSNPVGALLYAEGGTLKVRQADGTVFAISAPPVTSVNAKTGAVALTADDVGAAAAAHTHTAADVGAVATGTAVLLTGAQTVAGNKTFSGNVIVQGVGQTQAIVKAADTSRASTSTVANDAHLILPVVANATYIVEAVLVWSNGGGGFRADWAAPSGATMVWTDNDGAGAAALGTDLTFSVTTGTTFQGALVVSGTAGNLTLRWAQNASDAAATVLLAGCYLKLERVA